MLFRSVSAKTGEGLDRLRRTVASLLSHRYVEAEIELYAGNGRLLAYLGAHGQIVEQRFEGDQVHMRIRVARHVLDRVRGELKVVSLSAARPEEPQTVR